MQVTDHNILDVFFLYGNKAYNGTASNLSKSGMLLQTKAPLPFNEHIKILLHFNKKRVMVPVMISVLVKTDSYPYALIVKVLTNSKDYLKIVDKFDSISNSKLNPNDKQLRITIKPSIAINHQGQKIKYTLKKLNDIGFITFSGELTKEHENDLAILMMRAIHSNERVVLNFKKVTRIDSQCMQIFRKAYSLSNRLKNPLIINELQEEYHTELFSCLEIRKNFSIVKNKNLQMFH